MWTTGSNQYRRRNKAAPLPKLGPFGQGQDLMTQMMVSQVGLGLINAEIPSPFGGPSPVQIDQLLSLVEQYSPDGPPIHTRAIMAHFTAAREAKALNLLDQASYNAGMAYAACLRSEGQEAQAVAMMSWAQAWITGRIMPKLD